MTDIFGATTQAISSVKSLSDINPAKMLSGVVADVENGVNTVSKSLGIGNIFAVHDAGLEETDIELPIPNVLHNYATYNYILSIGCLDIDSYNYPGSSYIAGKLPPLICKSASGDPNNRILFDDNKKYDFFIDDLVIEGYAAFSEHSGNTTNTTIEFTIIEPYSMGMFMQAVQIAAYNQGYKNWRGAPYLLMIEFRGNTETGQLKTIPNTTKFIPFKFNHCNMKVTEAGAVYSVRGYINNGEALNDSNKKLKSDITIAGKTVQEVLQSGPKSLQNVVNERYKQLKKDKAVNVQDEILILFPTNISSNNSATLVKPGDTESKTSATSSSSSSGTDKLYKTLGVSRSSTSASLVQIADTCNELGKAKVGFNNNRGGNSPMPEDNAVYDEQKKIVVRSKVQPKPEYTDFKFNRDSDIVNAINQVMLTSEVALAVLDSKQIDDKGYRPWWRIDTQVYYIASDANLKTTGELPKLYVYRVVPYKVHASKMLPPGAPAPKLPELKKEVVKEYNYIYTGKNIDLLRFEFEMSQAFMSVYASDNFTKGGDTVIAQQAASSESATPTQTELANPAIPQGSDKLEPGMQTTVMKFISTLTSTDSKGGARGDTEATRAARLFHDAVINSKDMQHITFDIIGDPYYIASSGCGNFVDTQLKKHNITKDGSINYLNGEVHTSINFRTPTDINQTTGLYDLKNSTLCHQFSGLFKINTIKSEFRHGQFRQTLEGYRIQGQDSKEEFTEKSLLSIDKIPLLNTGTAIDASVNNVIKEFNTIAGDINKSIESVTNQINKGIQTVAKEVNGIIK